MNKLKNSAIILFIISSLFGCSQSIDNYATQSPALDLSKFFNGSLVAHGIVQDYKGQVTRRFKVDLVAKWQGDQGVIDEVFYFDDGEVDYRCWRLTKSANRYIGTANDVVGKAQGVVSGNTLNWKYDLNVKTDNGEMTLFLDDWLYLIDDNTLINKTDMSLFGLDVAEVTLSINKQPHLTDGKLSANCQFPT